MTEARKTDLTTIAMAMRDHSHGGTLLIVPNDASTLARLPGSLDIRFAGAPYERVKTDLAERDAALREFKSDFLWRFERAQQSLKSIGQLTAVDGAALVTYDLLVLGFGAKIKPSNKSSLDTALVSVPFENGQTQEKKIAELGGTRHQSAARFVFAQRESVAIVASQDGKLSLFAWDKARRRVSVIEHAQFLLL